MRVFLPPPREKLKSEKTVTFTYRIDEIGKVRSLVRISSNGEVSTAPPLHICRNWEDCRGIIVDGFCSAGCSRSSDSWEGVDDSCDSSPSPSPKVDGDGAISPNIFDSTVSKLREQKVRVSLASIVRDLASQGILQSQIVEILEHDCPNEMAIATPLIVYVDLVLWEACHQGKMVKSGDTYRFVV